MKRDEFDQRVASFNCALSVLIQGHEVGVVAAAMMETYAQICIEEPPESRHILISGLRETLNYLERGNS